MVCRKCGAALPEGAVYCHMCGIKQAHDKQRHRRGNGMGTAIKRGNTWTACVVVRYVPVEGAEPPRKKAVYRTKGGFRTKRDALDYCVALKQADYKAKTAALLLVSPIGRPTGTASWSTAKMLDRYVHPDDTDVIEASYIIRRS